MQFDADFNIYLDKIMIACKLQRDLYNIVADFLLKMHTNISPRSISANNVLVKLYLNA